MACDASTWIDLASAVGSLAAAGVALWLGVNANRKSREDAKTRAGLYAASIVARLTHTVDTVADCVSRSVFENLNVDLDKSNAQALERMRSQLSGNLFQPDQETLVNLVPLANNCASRIASAFDLLNLVKARLNGMPRNFLTAQGVYVAHRQKMLDEVLADLMQVQDRLRVALRECVDASEIAAPEPTGVEIYGDPAD